jgi:hypothetical protein
MNIEQAKAIPIDKILEHLNAKTYKITEQESWYFSPFRNEKTASFHVHHYKNLWFDFGEAVGGDQLHLIQTYLEKQSQDSSMSSALKWLENHIGIIKPFGSTTSVTPLTKTEPKLTLLAAEPIRHIALIHYLEKRGIPLKIANRYIKQIRFRNRKTGKTMFSLGWKNEDEGYELNNPNFKGCIGTKDITFIRGTNPKPEGIHIFEGMTDFLSVITNQNGKPLIYDSLILNSVSCIKRATPYIKNYGYRVGYTWLDNDQAGRQATKSIIQLFNDENMVHIPMNGVYRPYKDVNAWHMHRLEL